LTGLAVTVLVEPAVFEWVAFSSGRIADITAEVIEMLGADLGDDVVTVKVDESTSLTRGTLESWDPVVIAIEAGAFEDPRLLRQLDPERCRQTLARFLLRALDRRPGGGFENCPPDGSMDWTELVAWDAHVAGRLSRLGLEVSSERWRFHFSRYHGHSPAALECFERLWSADHLDRSGMAALVATINRT
jgi:hypothetical protein